MTTKAHAGWASGDTKDREMVFTRTIDAPRELVYSAWTDPSRVAKWWGPRGFRTTIKQMDVRPGGVWKYTMHGPDGTDYANASVFIEVVPNEKLVYSHGGGSEEGPGVQFQSTVTFEDVGGKTRVTLRGVFPTKNALQEAIAAYGALEGGKQTMERLDEYVARTRSGMAEVDRPFVLTRVFDAPVELVYKVWTQKEHLQKWFGPKGTTMPECSLDLRVGGTFHYCMQFNKDKHWGKWVFREVTPPTRLVFTVSFADEHGNPVRNPWEPKWPMQTLSTVTFAPHAGLGGGTTVTVEWSPLDATEPERRIFHEGRESMASGWGGTMDQLAEYLRSAK